MSIEALVIDDERLLAADIESRLNQRPGWRARAYTDSQRAYEAILAQHFDVCFLDIEMPEESGLELAQRITAARPRTSFVFVTAHQQYAVDAFRLSALDYLVKPINDNILSEACLRVEQELSGKPGIPPGEVGSKEKISIKSQKRLSYIEIDSLIAGKAEGNYLSLYTEQGNFMPRTKIADFLSRLHGYGFIQTHRSYFVNPRKVVAAQLKGARIVKLELLNKITAPVSDSFAEDVESALGKNLLRGRF